jgi:NitT/TauT family transport system permease protein
VWRPFSEWVDRAFQRRAGGIVAAPEPRDEERPSKLALAILTGFSLLALYGGYRAADLLVTLPGSAWAELGKGIIATFVRVSVALAITLVWTIPVGVLIGTNRKLATVLQPIVQVVASIPATALFPVVLIALLQVRGGLNIAAVLLMLMGTQWYLLFNVIAGASAIPKDLRDTTDMLRLPLLDRWRTLILPALFPYIITGSITASGGAWNASIVAEHVEFGGETHATTGVGALIAQATATGDYASLLAGTLALVFTVILINRTFWRQLYRLAEQRYRME